MQLGYRHMHRTYLRREFGGNVYKVALGDFLVILNVFGYAIISLRITAVDLSRDLDTL